MKKLLLLLFVVFSSTAVFAQLEVKPGSFKEVTGFVNINTEKMYDDNDKPYAVLKIKTVNIDGKQRRELKYGNKMTIFDLIIINGELIEIRKRDKGNPLSGKDEKIAEEFVKKYWQNIVEKWISFFVYKKRVRCTDIKTK